MKYYHEPGRDKMILLADGFERAKLKDIFYSLIQIEEYQHPAIKYRLDGSNITFHAEDHFYQQLGVEKEPVFFADYFENN
jgi:hypothetical protein